MGFGFRNGPSVVKLQSNCCRCRALASSPWSTRGRRHDVIRFNRAPISGHVVHLVRCPNSKTHGISRSCVPAGTFGEKRLGRCPELSDLVRRERA